mgnify:FL=1
MIEITIDTKSPYKTIKYLNKLNINIYNINYNKTSISLKINQKDLKKLSKYYKYKIVKKYGIKEVISYLKKNYISIIYTITILLTISLITKITLSVEVITENSYLRKHITNELDKNNISKYKIIKSPKEILNIKEKILNNNKELLEWINIEQTGMKYIINIQPKIIKNKNNQDSYCNIISTKEAIITKIITNKGVELVSQNDKVSKDDILISGDIIYNNEIKKQVCANGTVYGTTWYTVNISIPTTYQKEYNTKDKRYNLFIKYNNKKKYLFKEKYKEYKKTTKRIINIFGIELYLQKETKIKKELTKYKEEELNKLIEKELKEKLSYTLKGNYNIKEQKTLKKQINNSKIELEIFIVAEEQISTKIIEQGSD